MNFKKILFLASLLTLSCSDDAPSDEIIDITNPTTTNTRVTEAIGLLDGVEVTREVYTYSEGRLATIITYSIENGVSTEVDNSVFVYDGNTITETYNNGEATYEVDSNNLASMSYLLNDDPDFRDGYTIDFSNNQLDNYVFFEGNSSQDTWYHRQTPVYDGERIISSNEESMHTNEPNFEPQTTTTFNYENDELVGWSLEYTEPTTVNSPPFNERIDHEYSNGRISRTVVHLFNPITSEFNPSTEINYVYDDNGNLTSASYIETGGFLEENHLLDYFFFSGDEVQDFDEVRYTYEEGDNNNYILLFPEFILHRTPNPYVVFE